jgi:hypothetical protein
MPLLPNGLVGEWLNEPHNSQGCNQCGIITHTHKGEKHNIKVEQNSHRREYATIIRECSKERKIFTKGTEARGSNTTITTPTPDVSRRPLANLHEAAQGLPPLENRLVGEGLNEPPNSQGCNQCGLLHTHTRGRDSNKVEQIPADAKMPLLLGNAVRKFKYSQRELRHKSQTPQSRHRHQILVRDGEQTSTKRPQGCLCWKMVW